MATQPKIRTECDGEGCGVCFPEDGCSHVRCMCKRHSAEYLDALDARLWTEEQDSE